MRTFLRKLWLCWIRRDHFYVQTTHRTNMGPTRGWDERCLRCHKQSPMAARWHKYLALRTRLERIAGDSAAMRGEAILSATPTQAEYDDVMRGVPSIQTKESPTHWLHSRPHWKK